jgi:hypothetical protein
MKQLKQLSEDYTAGVLAGIPLFCINRLYKVGNSDQIAKIRYTFTFDNGYGASIVEFHERIFSSGCQYELAVLDKNDMLCYDTYITTDVERGDEKDMYNLLTKIEQLSMLGENTELDNLAINYTDN